MPRSNLINLSYGDIAPADMILDLECWPDELSPAQMAAYQQAEKEHNDIDTKLKAMVSSTRAESVFLGEVFSAYQVSGAPPIGLEEIAKPVAVVRKETKARQQAEEKKYRAERERQAARKRENAKLIQVIDDDDDDDDEQEYIPLSKRVANRKTYQAKIAPPPQASPKLQVRGKVTEKLPVKPTENTAVGGLTIGDAKKKDVVDLTKDEPTAPKPTADTREVTFNKLQGKTFPSLVVVARPTLKVKDTNINDRPALDAKVKNVLMHTASKYTEWLIQQGLIRSEQTCQIHFKSALKLGIYSEAAKFPYSGGYVWISDCCPSRYVSVFSGSLFEGAPHPPSVLLKLIYHWSCQTNVQNVIQWVKVDNLYVKGFFTWLRAVCTVALHQHVTPLGGPQKRIEVGVISLGTTSQGGQQKQVKVEVLGVLDPTRKIVRLRAVEPLTDGEKNYRKRFAKILEPLQGWVNKESIIQTDLTVDKNTLLIEMGFRHVNQAAGADGKYPNANIMEYLRTVVPRMFQNTLSLLSRQIIQQFLDELMWRECYGTTPGKTFDNIISHISEQTRLDAPETLVMRLNKVAANPFKNWSHLSVTAPAKKIRADFFTTGVLQSIKPGGNTKAPHTPDNSATNRGRNVRNKRKEPSPPPPPPASSRKLVRVQVKEEPQASKKVVAPPKVATPLRKEVTIEPMIPLESFYYGMFETGTENDSATAVIFEANCPECDDLFKSNTVFMAHVKEHVYTANQTANSVQCRYCLINVDSQATLTDHISKKHPLETKANHEYYCVICWHNFATAMLLRNHMHKFHVLAELPFKCGCCDHLSSSLRYTVDHFYNDHTASGTLLCPFCLKIYVAVANNEQLTSNIHAYYKHLKQHTDASNNIDCSRCALKFLDKGTSRVHQMHDHHSRKSIQSQLRELCKDSTKITKPKWKSFYSKDPIVKLESYVNVTLSIGNGFICLECGADFQEDNHIATLTKCFRCNYRTVCSRAIMEHVSACIEADDKSKALTPIALGQKMFCICGFSSEDGNELASHLAQCDKKSAYETAEIALENTVKCNMLDMLDLVPRDGGEDDDSSDNLLIPADQQQQLLSKSIDGAGKTTAATAAADDDDEDATKGHAPQAIDDFNTQLSLDDLAPASVAPPNEQDDRTPTLSDEYQSLATPRVASYPPQYDSNEFQ